MPESPNIIGQLAIQYSNRPAIKALLKLIPGGSSADTLLQKRADEIKGDRVKVFFEELAQGKRELTDDLIQTEDFLHSYFCTLRASESTAVYERAIETIGSRLVDRTTETVGECRAATENCAAQNKRTRWRLWVL